MTFFTRSIGVAAGFIACFMPAAIAQEAFDASNPAIIPYRPQTREERNQRRALGLYAEALLLGRNNRLADAVKALEQAVEINPEASPLHKALIPLYMALDRPEDALAACRKALTIDPEDYETWYLKYRQFKLLGRPEDAVPSLAKAFACPRLREYPEAFMLISVELARAFEEQKAYTKALGLYQRIVEVLAEDPDSPKLAEIYEAMGHISVQARNSSQAIAAFREARRRFADEDPIRATHLLYDLARAYESANQPKKSLLHLNNYLRTQPATTEPYEFLVGLLKRMGRDQEIVSRLKEFSNRDAHNLALKQLLARQCAQAARPHDAERIYFQIAKESPTPEVYRGLFSLYRSEKRMGDLLKILDTAIHDSRAKDDSDALTTQARSMIAAVRADVNLSHDIVYTGALFAGALVSGHPKLDFTTVRFLALLAAQNNQLAEAEILFRASLNGPMTTTVEAATYDGLLRVLWARHQYAAVVEICRKGLKEARSTNRLLFHNDMARALVLLNQIDDALKEADQAVQLADADTRLHFQLFRLDILRQADRYKETEAACLTLLRAATKPGDVRDIRNMLSNTYSAAGDMAKAEEQLRLILAADANDATANNDLGYLLANQGKNLEDAETMIRKALALDHDQKKAGARHEAEDDQPNAAYVDSLGWVLYRRGQWPAARRQMEKAVSLPNGADDPVVWGHLGDVYFRLEELAKAKEAWQKAVHLYETEKRRKLDDQYKELKHKLQELP